MPKGSWCQVDPRSEGGILPAAEGAVGEGVSSLVILYRWMAVLAVSVLCYVAPRAS
jgi:hypothetical protein